MLGSISYLLVDRRTRVWKKQGEKERLNFIGGVANNFFAVEAAVSAADASQLAIFHSVDASRCLLFFFLCFHPYLE